MGVDCQGCWGGRWWLLGGGGGGGGLERLGLRTEVEERGRMSERRG